MIMITWKTTFNMHHDLFEQSLMPFGLTDAPAKFMILMNKVHKVYLDSFVINDLDDILFFSEMWENNIQH